VGADGFFAHALNSTSALNTSNRCIRLTAHLTSVRLFWKTSQRFWSAHV